MGHHLFSSKKSLLTSATVAINNHNTKQYVGQTLHDLLPLIFEGLCSNLRSQFPFSSFDFLFANDPRMDDSK